MSVLPLHSLIYRDNTIEVRGSKNSLTKEINPDSTHAITIKSGNINPLLREEKEFLTTSKKVIKS